MMIYLRHFLLSIKSVSYARQNKKYYGQTTYQTETI